MDKDELAAALDEIAALDLPDVSRMRLEQMLLGPLIEKDPGFALTKFIGRIHEENSWIGWQLSNAMTEWARKDPTAPRHGSTNKSPPELSTASRSTAKSQSRMQFEGAMIGTLLSSNPEAAALRLAALPEDPRGDVLQHNAINSLKPEDQLAYAKLVRQSLPENERTECIAGLVSRMAYNSDDYSAVTEGMERIEATPEERAACIEKTADSRFLLSDQRTTPARRSKNYASGPSPNLPRWWIAPPAGPWPVPSQRGQDGFFRNRGDCRGLPQCQWQRRSAGSPVDRLALQAR